MQSENITLDPKGINRPGRSGRCAPGLRGLRLNHRSQFSTSLPALRQSISYFFRCSPGCRVSGGTLKHAMASVVRNLKIGYHSDLRTHKSVWDNSMSIEGSSITIIDHISAWSALVGFLLIAADQLIGKSRREAVKEKVGEWWLQISSTTYTGLLSKDADRIYSFLSKLFGKQPFSIKFISYALLCSVILTFSTTCLVIYIVEYLSSSIFSFDLIAWNISMWPIYVVNATLDWASLLATFYLLDRMRKSTSIWSICNYITIDIIVTILICLSIGVFIAHWLGYPKFLN